MNAEHCRDCCCAQSWRALGISSYTGKSIPEHIGEINVKLRKVREIVERKRPEGINPWELLHEIDLATSSESSPGKTLSQE